MKIISNGIPRSMTPFYALSEKDQVRVRDNYENADQFDWVRYKGDWYCLEDFMIVSRDSPLAGWDGYASDSFFSGVLIRLVDDGERAILGRYLA